MDPENLLFVIIVKKKDIWLETVLNPKLKEEIMVTEEMIEEEMVSEETTEEEMVTEEMIDLIEIIEVV